MTRICRGKVLLCPSKLLPSEQSKHTHTHTNQKCLGDIPPWPNQKPTSVPAKGCDLVWAYLEELIQLHETPTNGIEHNELGWWVKKSISGVQHLFPPSFWKNIQQTAAWNHHPNELGMIKFQWFFGRNIDVCVCVSVRWPYNPNKQLSQHESIWCPEKHTQTHSLGHTSHLHNDPPCTLLTSGSTWSLLKWWPNGYMRKSGDLVGWWFSNTVIKTS